MEKEVDAYESKLKTELNDIKDIKFKEGVNSLLESCALPIIDSFHNDSHAKKACEYNPYIKADLCKICRPEYLKRMLVFGLCAPYFTKMHECKASSKNVECVEKSDQTFKEITARFLMHGIDTCLDDKIKVFKENLIEAENKLLKLKDGEKKK